MKILIIRHAEPDYKNNTLTKKGFKEADLLGKYYKDKQIDYIYCSPLNRAKYTADGLKKYKPNAPIEYCDFLREIYVGIDLPYAKNHINWDLRPSYLDSDDRLFNEKEWLNVESFNKQELRDKFEGLKKGVYEILEKHGYKHNGRYFEVLKPNHDTICFVCHFGLESHLLALLLHTSPIALSNYTVAKPSSVSTLCSEEREKGKAIFRLNEFGNTSHLEYFNEEPSFMARFVECFDDEGENIDEFDNPD